MLVEADGKLVTQHALLDRSWPDTYVEDNTLQVHLSALRRALGDGRNRIMTVPRRGYRLVQRRRPPGAASDASHPDTSRPAALARQAIRVLQPPEVVGRAQAVAAVRAALERVRVLTLTGAGGIGKTTLSVALAPRRVSIRPARCPRSARCMRCWRRRPERNAGLCSERDERRGLRRDAVLSRTCSRSCCLPILLPADRGFDRPI